MENINYLSKRIFSTLILGCSFVFAVGQTEIANYEELNGMGTSGDYKLTVDITVPEDWTPRVFSDGTFDGNGHVIRGLKTNTPDTHRVGFFSEINRATVKNLGIEDARFIGNDDVGAIAAYSNAGVIEGCYVANSYIEGSDRAGALVGKIEWGTQIRNCYAAAEVKTRAFQVGGLVGASQDGSISSLNNPMQVIGSYFSGNVTGTWGRNCGILGLVNSQEPEIKIECCVNLASSLKGGGSAYRITDENVANSELTLIDNYSLSSTLCNNAVIATDNADYGASGRHGANITGGDAEAKTAAFYTGLDWDFTETWKILSDGYPVLKWQALPVNMAVTNLSEVYVLKEGETIDLNQIKSLNGVDLIFTSNSDKVIIVDNIATASGLVERADVSISIATSSADYTIVNNIINVRLITGSTPISTPAELALVTQNPGEDFELVNDIDLTGVAFAGLCSPESPFTGTFDGKGHVVKGLNYNNAATNFFGFFRKAVGATIKNLGIEEASIIANGDVGAIAGCADNTRIEQCYVSDSYIEGDDRSGAIVGSLYYGAVITDCYAVNASVKARSWQTGGIAAVTREGGGSILNTYYSGIVVGNAGNTCGILGLVHDPADNIRVENCVNLASSITNGVILRIANNNHPVTLANNYSLSATLCNDNEVPDNDSNYGADQKHGANIPEGDENALSKAFYESISWDFERIWKMSSNGYPIFQWQSIQTGIKKTDLYQDVISYTEANTVFIVSKCRIQQLSIYNLQGRLIYADENLNAFETQLNVDASGMYVAKLFTEEGVRAIKVLVK
jgi:hypothetical protein